MGQDTQNRLASTEIKVARLVLTIVGESSFVDLIAYLPDEFFKSDDIHRELFWLTILREICGGEKDHQTMINRAAKIAGIIHNEA